MARTPQVAGNFGANTDLLYDRADSDTERFLQRQVKKATTPAARAGWQAELDDFRRETANEARKG